MAEFLSADKAVARIPDGATLGMTGIVMCGVAEEVAAAIERAFRDRGHPRDLTLVHAAGIGNWQKGGVAHLGHEGLVTKWIGGHTGAAPAMAHLIEGNHCQAYCIPQGVEAQLYREIAAHRPGVITHVGIGTFVDPRLGGGRMNQATTADYVKMIEIEGREYLLYPSFPIDVAVIRGTTADELGNVTLDEEAVLLGQLPMAQAAKNSGGIVIAQVKYVAQAGPCTPSMCGSPPRWSITWWSPPLRSSIPRRPGASTLRCQGICGSPGRRPSRLPWVRAPWWSGVRPWSWSPVWSSTSASAIPTPWAGWRPRRGSTRW